MTDRGMTAEQVGQLEQIIKLFTPCMDDYLYLMDLKRDYYRISKTAVNRFLLPDDHFYNAREMHGTFVYPKDYVLLQEEFRKIQNKEISFHNLQYRWLDRKGEPVWINCRGQVLYDADGNPAYMIGCINEIGERQKADNTSGLFGEATLSAYMEEMDSFPDGFVLRIGIDGFKDIVGSLGSHHGDYILRKTAECIGDAIADNQKLFRLVGDEFVVLDLVGGNKQDALELYTRIRNRIDEFIEESGYQTVFTISGGIIDLAENKENYETLLKLSEFSINQAKYLGRNRCYTFEQKDYDVFQKRKKIMRRLYSAAAHSFEGFEVYYQPLVDSETYRLLGAEALMRYTMPDGTRVSPAEFIPILEETGLIIPAGRWMMQQALGTCKNWQQVIPEFKININLSYVQVMKSNVLKDLVDLIAKYDLKSSSVGVELTESGYLDSSPHFEKLWQEMKDHGFTLILDDFGTGYSNLHCLTDLNPTYIKIDRSFTLKALSRSYEYDLLVQIIEMAHRLNLAICIEGIETPDEMRRIQVLGAEYIQGYLFGKPCSKAEFEQKFLAEQR